LLPTGNVPDVSTIPPFPAGKPPGTAIPGFPLQPQTPPSVYTLATPRAAPYGHTDPGALTAAGPIATPPPLPPKKKPVSARRDLLIFVLVFVLLGAVGVGAYIFFTKPSLSEEAIASVKETVTKAAEMPGKAIESAKENMAQARGAEQQRVDKIAEGDDASERRALVATPAEVEAGLKTANKPAAKPTSSNPGPSVVAVVEPMPANPAPAATQTSLPAAVTPPPAPPASARFRSYANGLMVSGVFQGSPPRALIDGRIVRAGEVIDHTLGVTFVGVDPNSKHLILQDASKAEVRVKY
jgi:hypothetical protein